MPNVQIAGFQPARRSGGGFISYKRVRVLTNNTLEIALHDGVVMDANGNYLQASTTTTAVSTVSNGASYVHATLGRIGSKNLPAATLYTSTGVAPENASYISVVDNEVDVDFICSIDEAIALTDLFQNYAFVAGTAVNGISAQELDATGHNTTATLPWRVQDFVFAADNDVDAADVRVFAKINASQMSPALEIGGSLGL